MRIREKGRENDVEVYALYWAEYRGKRQRYYLVIPYEGYEGLSAVPESESELIDPNLEATFVLRKGDYGGDLIIHSAANEDDLVYGLLDHDPEAMRIFLDRLSKVT